VRRSHMNAFHDEWAGAREMSAELPGWIRDVYARDTTDLHEERLAAVLGYLRSVGARSVLDLGCGEGSLLLRLAQESQIHRIVGVDISNSSLACAQRALNSLPSQPAPQIELRCVSFMEANAEFADFDAAVLLETQHTDVASLHAPPPPPAWLPGLRAREQARIEPIPIEVAAGLGKSAISDAARIPEPNAKPITVAAQAAREAVHMTFWKEPRWQSKAPVRCGKGGLRLRVKALGYCESRAAWAKVSLGMCWLSSLSRCARAALSMRRVNPFKTEQSVLTAESRCCALTRAPSNLRSGSKRADGL